MNIILSICIPTYNRANYLDELFESISENNETMQNVEFCVSDNASIDLTEDVIKKWKANYRIKYIKKSENEGADLNYQSCVDHSSGKFCWYYGSDDLFSQGSILRVIELVSQESFDILLMDRAEFIRKDSRGSPIIERVNQWLAYDSKLFKFDEKASLVEYFRVCNSLGGVFSYLSSIVFRRSSWDNTFLDSSIIGTAYSHVFKLLQIMINNGKLFYTHEFFPLCRIGNDSFYAEGWRKRFLIDINGYEAISYKLFPSKNDNVVRHALLSVLDKEHGIQSLIPFFISEENTRFSAYLKLKSLGFSFPKTELALLLSFKHIRMIAKSVYGVARGNKK